MRVLVACEFSGVVRDAFAALGHDAWSCDIMPAKGNHRQCDVSKLLDDGWDLMVAHPPCTHLCVSGARHFKSMEKKLAQLEALEFFKLLLEAPIPKIAVENPVGIASTKIRKPDQIIQPYMFGDRERKTTCLWLVGLALLTPTDIVEPRLITVSGSGKQMPKWSRTKMSYRNPKLRQLRSITFAGIARAMAAQWGGDIR